MLLRRSPVVVVVVVNVSAGVKDVQQDLSGGLGGGVDAHVGVADFVGH